MVTMHGTAATPQDALLTEWWSRGLIAVVRAGVALMWIQNVAWKVPPDFGRAEDRGLFAFTSLAVEHPVFPPYSAIVDAIVVPNIEVFGWGVLMAEASLGAFLLIGLFTRFWAVVGVLQTGAIALSVLNAPDEWHWAYYLMGLAHLALFATNAGRCYGLDGALRRDPGSAILPLGVGSIAACVFLFTDGLGGTLNLASVTVAAAIALAACGALAIVAGRLRRPVLGVVAGAVLAAMALLQLIQLVTGSSILGGNASTMALLAAFGLGLIVASLAAMRARRDIRTPTEQGKTAT